MPSRTYPNMAEIMEEKGITKLTNCRLLRDGRLVNEDLWIDVQAGRIANPQQSFFTYNTLPSRVIDLKGKIVSPGFLDVQLNGALGFDFSELPADGNMVSFAKGLQTMNRSLIETGVTSYLATMTSQRSNKYHEILPFLGPSGASRQPFSGSESLGAHCEGPFIAHDRKGCHSLEVVLDAGSDCNFDTVVDYYGASNLGRQHDVSGLKAAAEKVSPLKMITMAPELPGALDTIRRLTSQGVLVSVGHTRADYEQTALALQAGATMITHLFNAMNSLHHRDPGPFGTITAAKKHANLVHNSSQRPYFGIIADGVHLHPASVSLAYSAHPSGFILVTDAVKFMGSPDGTYDWNNGQKVEKRGARITLEGTDTIAGCAVTLIDCINNFLNWTGASIAEALDAVTTTPATMLGIETQKGSLRPGADADLVILGEVECDGRVDLVVDEVWKFGSKVFPTNKI